MPRTDRPTPARFEGFADRDARFFKALAKHQDRAWFAAHREEYDEGWLAPMKALLAELREKLAPRYAHEEIAAPKVFRIHRDVRFSKDKSPTKRTSAATSASTAAPPVRPVPPRSTSTSPRTSSSPAPAST